MNLGGQFINTLRCMPSGVLAPPCIPQVRPDHGRIFAFRRSDGHCGVWHLLHIYAGELTQEVNHVSRY